MRIGLQSVVVGGWKNEDGTREDVEDGLVSLALFPRRRLIMLRIIFDENDAYSSTRYQHWWFSGKIGRCHLKDLRIQEMSASPGFDSRPMHRGARDRFQGG
jgi:hypothetical protein